MERKLERILQAVPERAQEELVGVTLLIAGIAMRRAPVDTGHLRESGYVHFQNAPIAKGSASGQLQLFGTPRTTGDAVLHATIGFNATTDDGRYSYALIQHERTDFQHPRGGEAKYLESAMGEGASRLKATLERELRRSLGS